MVNRAWRASTDRPLDVSAGDDGVTLLELIVAMGIFLIFVALILGTTVTLARSASRTQLVAESSNSTLTLFASLDRQTRYADSINFPGAGATAGSRYVEFRVPGVSVATGGTCTQWRFRPDLSRIESRSWQDLPGVVAPIAWGTKLTNVIDDGGASYPFALIAASNGGSTMQQFVITVHAGNASLNAGAAMNTMFVARNSSILSPSNADANNDGVSDVSVCPGGNRP